MGVVADADAIGDRPIEAGREQDVGAGEAVGHQILPPVRERRLDMPQLPAKIFACLRDNFRRDAIDGPQRIGAMAAHHIEARRVELGDDKETPLEPARIVALRFRNQGFARRGIGAGQIGDNGGTLADREVAVLQQRNLLSRIEPGVFRGLGLAGARTDRPDLVGQAKLVQGPVRAHRAAGPDAPQGEIRQARHHQLSTDGRRSSSWVQPSLLC